MIREAAAVATVCGEMKTHYNLQLMEINDKYEALEYKCNITLEIYDKYDVLDYKNNITFCVTILVNNCV